MSIIVVTLAVAVVTAVFGELIPKTLALAHAERYALVLARPVELVGTLLAPVVSILDGITRWVTRGWACATSDRDRLSPEELMILVERGGEQGIIEAEEEQMIGAVLGLGERKVHEVMVPRIAIVGAARDRDPGPDRGHHRGGGPLADPGLRGLRGQHRGHPVRQGPAAVPQGRGPAAAGAHDSSGRPCSCPSR